MRNLILAALLAAFSSVASANSGFITEMEEAIHHVQEVGCLADAIYFEARGESREGRMAVAHVTLNRMKSRAFPNTVCEVVHFRHRGVCAYSWSCNRKPVRELEAYENAIQMAWDIYRQRVIEGRNDNITHGATHFHNETVSNPWQGYSPTVVIGTHTFYKRDRG